jgi:hypothetical protein
VVLVCYMVSTRQFLRQASGAEELFREPCRI